MKKKTFILTLMMLLCSFVHGQDYHWTVNGNDGDYASNFTIDAIIQLDGVLQNRSNLELGVFHGDECRATTMTTDLGTGQYIAELFVFGEFGQNFTLKLYDHATGKTYSDNYIIKFEDNTITDLLIPYIEDYQYGEIFNPAVINFKTPNYYTPDTSGDDGNMTLTSVIFIDGVEQHNSNLELGAFCGNVVKGSAKANMVDTNFGITRNYAKMVIGGKSGNVITFRLYDHASGKELEFVDVNTINYTTNASLGTILDPFVVNFITSPYVAQIGETKYQSFDAALEAAQDGDDIILLTSISLTETAVLSKDINISLNGKTVAGTIELAHTGATVTGAQDAVTSVITNIADHKVVYADETYKVVAKVYVAQVGETKYETLEEAYNAATATNGIVLLSNITLQSTWKIEKAINIALNNNTVAGTIELANVGATVTGVQDAVTSVITNIADYKVVYENGMYKVVAKVYVAQVGSTKYESLEEAYNAATAENGIVLLSNITLQSAWKIEKSINIALGEYKVAGTIELANAGATVTGAQDAVTSVITNIADYKVVYEGGMYKVVAKVYVAQVGSTKYESLEEAYNAATAENGIVLLSNITLQSAWKIEKAINIALNNNTVAGTIELANAGATVTGAQDAVTSVITNIADQKVVYEGGMYKVVAKVYVAQVGTTKYETLAEAYNAATAENGIVLLSNVTLQTTWKIEKDINISLNGKTISGTIELANTGATVTGAQNAVTSVITNIADYKVVYADGTYKVVAKDYVAQVGSTKYESLEEAIAAVPANQTITVLKDITLAQTLTIAAEKSFTLDLNGKTINAGFQPSSTDKHIYAFDNKGTLTLANGTISARGIFNYGTLTVKANATINSIDANGGYGVDNYGTLNVYGTIATTTEDNDAPATGNYDATPINNRTNATVNVFEGSVIANVSNFTYGIENNGTLNITGGTISSKHSTIGNYGTMTVEGGTIICDGYEGVSSQVIVAWNGSTTNITGGTFDGKDNNNGFNVDAEAGAIVKIEGGNFLSCYSGSLYGAGTIEVSGGKFFDAVPENRCAAGYIPTQFTDGTYGVKPGSYIAQIGTTKYETFDEAYTAAKTGDVVVLFRTVVITNSKPWINYSKKNITVKAEFGETAFRVQDGAYVWFGGMTIESNDYCIIVGASDSSSGATVELYGGTYYGATSAVSVTKGDVKIMDGTFKVEPYQGSYEYTINCIDANYNNKTAEVAIQGGKFYNFNPMNNAAEGANTNFVVANHITVKDTDNYWTVVALPTTDKIVSSEDHTVTSNGYGPATVTVTGEVPCVANGQGIVSNWIGFRITKPEGVDANVARVFTPGSNGTYNEKTLASILDEGKDYASMWASIQYKREFDYKIDWNNDGIMDLVINIDATAATIKHNYVEVERVEPSYGQDGYILYRCGCGHEYKEILPAENVAQIGETKYTTLEAAAAAAKANETIVVLADVETTNVALPTDVTLDLNGKTVEADIIGKISINKGLWVTKEGYKMIGDGAEYYQTTDATIVMGANYSIEMLSGIVNLVQVQWYTLEGQNITIKQGATFNISAGQTFVINGSTIENNGTVNNAGTIQILAGTVKGNIAGNLHFKGGNYITADNHKMVGTTSEYHYNATDALVNIATNGDITIAAGAMTLGHDWRTLPGQTVTVAEGAAFTVPTGMTYQIYGTAIVNGTITVNGTVELTTLTATLKAQAGLNVITKIEDHKVVYAEGMYKVVAKAYVAQIGTTKYETLEAAAAAAQTGETITVLVNVETTNVTLPENVTLDLNGKTVKADIIGKILINNGLWVTKEGYEMIGNGADYYQTTDATIVMGANYSIEMLSGIVNLVPVQWYTLEGQNITIKQGATFNISAGQTFVINGSTVENNGTVNNAGTIQILAGTVKGNIAGNLHFKGGNYITADNHKMVGTTSEYHYNATDALVNIATNGDITIAAGAMTLGHDWRTLPGQTVTVAEGATFTVPSGMTYQIYGTAIVNGTLTVNGTVELAVLEATLKAQSGLNVITNIANHAVAYENGTYKVVQSIYEQRQILGAGWNWFSSYININGETGFEKLQTALGTNGLHIKNQHYFVDYNEGWGWNGTLESTSVEEMYMIQTSEQVELVLTGELANPATEITLKEGWTYIGYPVATAMNIEDALAGITPNDGDIIKTHYNAGVAQYYAETKTWYSQSLTSMTPGFGYMYKNNGGEQTLVYSAANTRAEVRANVTSENNRWVPNASAFANNMNIIAVLESNDMMGEFEVAAFVNGEVRGSARPTYVEPIDAYVLFMTIYGEEGDELTFKYYDIYSDEEHSINNTLNYSDNAVIGSIKAPYMFFANTLGMDENAANTLSLYPNPTTTNAAISFETIYDIVEVFNSLGVKVAEYRNVDRIEGMEAAGVYVIRVTNDSTVQNCRLIVK